MHSHFPKIEIGPLSEYRAEDVMVSRFGQYLQEHRNLVFPHRHSFYHLVLFTAGAGSHIIDFNHFTVEKRQMYFMLPGQVHDWHFEGDVEGYVVNFSESFFQSFLLQPDYLDFFPFLSTDSRKNVIQLDEPVFARLTGLFEALLEQASQAMLFRKDMIRVLLLQVFITIAQTERVESTQTKLAHKSPVVREFQKLVERSFTTIKQPGAYAALLNVTPNHLNALSKEHLGMQAGEVIRARIILEAKRLLINRTLTISQIADQLQFSDNSYFTKFFKKETGVTPEGFRGGF